MLKLNNVTITEGNSITRYITLYEFQVKRDFFLKYFYYMYMIFYKFVNKYIVEI